MGEDGKSDIEKVGLFIDGPYDTEVTLFRPDVAALMGRDGPMIDDELRLGGPYPICPGHKLKAATNDWTFSPFLYLWEEEEYQDPDSWRKIYKQEQSELAIEEAPWIPASGSKTMNGLGTYFGTFITEMEAFSPEVKDKEEDEMAGVAQILSNPGKKGSGYGYNDICINPYPEWEEDPSFDFLEAHREMREAFEEARDAICDHDWIPPWGGNGYFDPNPYLDENEGGEETYDWDRLIPPADPDDMPIWIPSNFTKRINGNKDVMVPFERWPEYDPSDPYEDIPYYVFRQPDKEMDEDLAPWIPGFGGNKTLYFRPIIPYNVKLWVNPTNFHLF